MNDKIFGDMAEQMRPDDDVRAALTARLAGDEPGTALAPRASRRRTGWFAAAACVLALASGTLLPGAIGHDRSIDLADPPLAAPPAAPDPSAPVPAGEPAPGYAELLTAVQRASVGWDQSEYGASETYSLPSSVTGNAPVPAAAPQAGTYQTNVQVAGIDEGDIVKSDGRAIYLTSGKEVVVFSADGAATRELARIDTSKGEAADTSAVEGDYVAQGPVADMMLVGDTLVVLVTDYATRDIVLPASRLDAYLPLEAAITKALLYDVSNPAEPKYVTSLGQSGSFVTSRLLDGVLYLVTEYLVSDPDAIEPGDPETFVPLTTKDGTRTVVPAPDCFPLPYSQGPRYAVASSIDVAARERIDTEAVLGGSQTVHMSTGNLFLAATDYAATLTASQRKAAGVNDLVAESTGVTHLARLKLDAGRLTLGAQATVPGQVLNQFALDDFGGHLRIVTTVSGESKSGDWVTRPALYVLDSKLKVAGSLPKLAKNESVESVRFDGEVGYVVSFERRDPLFAIDLSNPSEPKVMSALKIPGFSAYLDVWSSGRLLGLGVDADDLGERMGLKLSMFDTSDLFDVSELTTTKVAFDDSEALHNHKAVLVDRERGLIGFPAVSWKNDEVTARYLVYGYDVESGFRLLEKLPLQADGYNTTTNVRGLRITDFLYVASPAGVEVYSADSFGKVGGVKLG